MATIVKLTNYEGKFVLVNLDRIIVAHSVTDGMYAGYTDLAYDDTHSVLVEESLEMVYALAVAAKGKVA